jgi:predicted metalloprotease with PDZ domain
LGQTITRVIRSGGRQRQSVAESSFDAWTKFYKQDANAPNAIISYYTKGALIAATLDLKLRAQSDGELSLDDIMRACWDRWGKGEEGMPEGGFESLCAELAGDGFEDFFEAAVRGTGELPLQSILATVGVNYHLRQAASLTDKGGKKQSDKRLTPLWLGANLSVAGDKLTFSSVLNGGPAEQAGVAPGDVAIALDGVALSAANCDKRLRSFRRGETLELVFFRGDDLMTTSVTLVDAPENTCYLSIDEEADLATVTRRDDWLNSA